MVYFKRKLGDRWCVYEQFKEGNKWRQRYVGAIPLKANTQRLNVMIESWNKGTWLGNWTLHEGRRVIAGGLLLLSILRICFLVLM